MTVYKISLSDEQADKLAGWLSLTTGEVDTRVAEEIRAQIPKPVIEEPREWGSVVRATGPGMAGSTRWFRDANYWRAEVDDLCSGWRYLENVEVLRVGIDEPEPLAQWETELLQSQERREIAAAVLGAMDVDQYLIDAVVNARPR